MANEKSQNVQDVFLNHVRKNKTPVTVFLVNGVKLQGIITWFDNFSVLLRRDGHTQLVYKHAISTVMPGAPIQLFDAAKVEGAGGSARRGRSTAAARRLTGIAVAAAAGAMPRPEPPSASGARGADRAADVIAAPGDLPWARPERRRAGSRRAPRRRGWRRRSG